MAHQAPKLAGAALIAYLDRVRRQTLRLVAQGYLARYARPGGKVAVADVRLDADGPSAFQSRRNLGQQLIVGAGLRPVVPLLDILARDDTAGVYVRQYCLEAQQAAPVPRG